MSIFEWMFYTGFTVGDYADRNAYQFRIHLIVKYAKVRKSAKIRNQCNQAPYLTQDTNGKVTTSQLDITNESQEVSPFPAGDQKASINRHARKHNKMVGCS